MDEEGPKVRLVRCPKCQNLLSQLPHFSIYKCGACGAFLRAKNGQLSDGLSEKSVSLESASESESNGWKKERAFSEENVNLIGRSRRSRSSSSSSSSTRTENREFVRSFDQNTSREANNLRVEETDKDEDFGYYDDRYTPCLMRPSNNWVHGNSHEVNMNKRSDFGNSCVENEVKEFEAPIGDFAGSLRSRPNMDRWGVERDELVAFHGSGRGVDERRFSAFPNPDEGPSNYQHGSFQGYAEQKRIHHDLDGPTRVEKLGHDRAELLKKLDELKDQISRSCDVTEGPSNYQHRSFHVYVEQKRIHHDLDGPSRVKNLEPDLAELIRKLDELKDQFSKSCDVVQKPMEWVPTDRKMAPLPPPPLPLPPPPPPPRVLPNRYFEHNSYAPEGPTSLYTAKMDPLAQDEHILEPLYFNHNREPVPHINSRSLDMQDFYLPPRNFPNEFLGYEHSYLPQNLRRTPYQPSPQYLAQPYHDHFPGHYKNFNPSTIASHQHEAFTHQLACSCLQCNKSWQIPPELPHPVASSRPPNDPINPVFSHPVSSQGYDSRGGNPTHLHFPTAARSRVQACHPIAGGAPFFTCHSCFELLKLERKFMVTRKNQQKVRCGGCSAINVVEFEKKRIIISNTAQLKQVSAKGDDGFGETLNENLQSPHDCLNAGAMNSCSDEYDNSGYTLTDIETNVLSSDQMLNFGESNERQESLSSSSGFSDDEQSPECMNFQKDTSKSDDLPPDDDSPLPFPDSIQQKDSSAASSNNVVSRYGMGSTSKRDNQEKAILERSSSTLQQNSVKYCSEATEMDFSLTEFQNSGVSHDSAEVCTEEDRPKINKGSGSFFAAMKKTFDGFSRSSQSVETRRPNVFVNGQAISDHVVKMAENLAGPIQPGNYWYDYRAGFWGVMGYPCLGIIPPFIQEFNYPIPENCAAGNTSVFVNRRELNQKDLDLLADRGLPTTRDKYYIVEISGKVLDEYTGEKLKSLGKLAPTVQKAKCGFGMKVPRALAQSMD